MIIVNEVKINAQGNLYTNIETGVGFSIISAKLWTTETFDDALLAKDFSAFLSGAPLNKEVFTITPGDVGLSSFNGIHFIEYKTDQPEEGDPCNDCSDSILVVVTDFTRYYKCISEYILKSSVCYSNLFSSEVCNSSEVTKAMTLNLLIKAIEQTLELGQLVEAIELTKKMDKLCSGCTTCDSIVTTTKTVCTSCNSYY